MPSDIVRVIPHGDKWMVSEDDGGYELKDTKKRAVAQGRQWARLENKELIVKRKDKSIQERSKPGQTATQKVAETAKSAGSTAFDKLRDLDEQMVEAHGGQSQPAERDTDSGGPQLPNFGGGPSGPMDAMGGDGQPSMPDFGGTVDDGPRMPDLSPADDEDDGWPF